MLARLKNGSFVFTANSGNCHQRITCNGGSQIDQFCLSDFLNEDTLDAQFVANRV